MSEGNGHDTPKPLTQQEFTDIASRWHAGTQVTAEEAGRLIITLAMFGRDITKIRNDSMVMSTALAGLTFMVSSNIPVPCQRQHGVKSTIIPKAILGSMNKHGMLDVKELSRGYQVSWKEPAQLIQLSRNIPHDPTPSQEA